LNSAGILQTASKFTFTVGCLGRDEQYTFYASCMADQRNWQKKIREQQRIIEEKYRRFNVERIPLADFEESNPVLCSVTTYWRGSTSIFLGTEDGIFVVPDDGKSPMIPVAELKKVQQLGVLHELDLLVALSKFFFFFSSDDPRCETVPHDVLSVFFFSSGRGTCYLFNLGQDVPFQGVEFDQGYSFFRIGRFAPSVAPMLANGNGSVPSSPSGNLGGSGSASGTSLAPLSPSPSGSEMDISNMICFVREGTISTILKLYRPHVEKKKSKKTAATSNKLKRIFSIRKDDRLVKACEVSVARSNANSVKTDRC
jgi:hypothetical protein